uniref:Centriolar and ciliogenesis-associated protein HYLS1 C-terminal domain-containing protein n=1 Tax=Globodera rostochiensis TaxID=31243 RepID=A0A914HYM7_GLORO
MDLDLASNGDVFEDFGDLVRDIINEMGYNVEEQQLQEIEKDLRLLDENADVADSKLFSCLLDNYSEFSTFASDPEQSLQQLVAKVDSDDRRPCSTKTQVKRSREFDHLIALGYERLHEVYADIKRYEQLLEETDTKQIDQPNTTNATSEDDFEGNSDQFSQQNRPKGAAIKGQIPLKMPTTSNGKENRRPTHSFGTMKPREETRLLNHLLKNNAMRRTMCPAPGRLPFKHDKQLKLEQYRREWGKNPPPGEQKRMALRWRIRELMMTREIPQLRIITTDEYFDEGADQQKMGPNEKSHNFSSPIKIDSIESDDEEMARLRAEGWHVGFGVEMRVAVVGEGGGGGAGDDDNRTDSADSSNNDNECSDVTTDDGQNDEEEENVSTPYCGYLPLPSSVADDDGEASSTSTTTTTAALQWLPTNSTPNNLSLLPPPPTADMDHIRHQPIDINLDQVKVDEIRIIMAQMTMSTQQPEWTRQIDDLKLAELVKRLKK